MCQEEVFVQVEYLIVGIEIQLDLFLLVEIIVGSQEVGVIGDSVGFLVLGFFVVGKGVGYVVGFCIGKEEEEGVVVVCFLGLLGVVFLGGCYMVFVFCSQYEGFLVVVVGLVVGLGGLQFLLCCLLLCYVLEIESVGLGWEVLVFGSYCIQQESDI